MMTHKKVLMIHEVTEKLFNLPLENYILTFDDGLYSQYYHFKHFESIDTEKIFFVSSNIICDGNQSNNFLTCSESHKKAFLGNKEDYMTLEQVKELMSKPNVSIGGHSHDHKNLTNFVSLYEKITYIENDTKSMIEWFKINLNLKPTKFCFPYNNDYNGLYKSLLKKYGFTDFYGSERTPIETLLHT